MANNIHIGADAEINHRIAILRDNQPTGKIVSGEEFSPGIWFSNNPNAVVQGRLAKRKNGLFTATIKAPKNCEWLALHISLGGFSLTDRDVLGFIAKTRSGAATSTRACIRSATEAGFSDVFFDKHIVSYGKESTHLDVLQTSATTLPSTAAWREFILFFSPSRPLDLSLQDLRFFVV